MFAASPPVKMTLYLGYAKGVQLWYNFWFGGYASTKRFRNAVLVNMCSKKQLNHFFRFQDSSGVTWWWLALIPRLGSTLPVASRSWSSSDLSDLSSPLTSTDKSSLSSSTSSTPSLSWDPIYNIFFFISVRSFCIYKSKQIRVVINDYKPKTPFVCWNLHIKTWLT